MLVVSRINVGPNMRRYIKATLGTLREAGLSCRSYRSGNLDVWIFTTLDEVRDLSEDGRQRYNTERTHHSLGDVPPLTFLPRTTSPDQSHFPLCA